MARANNPDSPPDDGKIGTPRVDGGMNKIPAPKKSKGKKKKKPKAGPPDLSDTNYEAPEPDDEISDEEADSKGAQSKSKDDEEEDDADLLARIKKRFKRCVEAEGDNRRAAVEDRKFKANDQWPADVMAQRATDKRPCLTVNRLGVFIRQVTNDQRQNRPAINVSPVGDKGDPEAAKMYRGMIRAIERDSSADIAYDTAFDDAVTSGFGYIRILTENEAPDSFDQVIVIKRVRNPFTVYLDPDHQEPDGADCQFGFVTEMIPRDEFKEQWPDADQMPWTEQAIGDNYKDWSDKDTLRIAEYFEIRNRERTLVRLENGWSGWEDNISDKIAAQIRTKRVLVERSEVRRVPYIRWYKVTAKDILERNDWLGQWIPIVPVIGNEIDIEGKVKLSGLIRDSKDAQRAYNSATTAEVELVSLAPKAPFIMEEGQVEGHEDEWKVANTQNQPYLTYKGTNVAGRPAPPPQRQNQVQVPAGWFNIKQGAAQDLMATTGIRWDPTNSESRVDDSGRAVRELRRSSDMGASHYMDNLGRSLKHIGRQLIDLIPKIYNEKRVVMILREDDTEERVEVNPNMSSAYMERQDGNKKKKIFNPSYGKYGVTVTIGPSYATKRIEAAESMMAFAKALPHTAALVADLIAKYQDWPGSEEMATRLAKAVPPQLLTPDQKDIPPQMQAVMQHMEQQIKALTQQLQQAMAALNDKDKDRAVALRKIELDFESKLFAVVEKAESAFQKHADNHLDRVAKMTDTLLAHHSHAADRASAAATAANSQSEDKQDAA